MMTTKKVKSATLNILLQVRHFNFCINMNNRGFLILNTEFKMEITAKANCVKQTNKKTPP